MPKKIKIPVVIVGTGGHAKVIAEIAKLNRSFKFLGFVDQKEAVDPACKPVLGDLNCLDKLKKKNKGLRVVFAIGDNAKRRQVAETNTIESVAMVHPKAVVSSSATISPGSVVMAGATINPHVKIGRHCIVNTGAILDHDCLMEDFSSVAPGCVLGGAVQIKCQSAIGIGAVILHGVTVGAYSVIGAGAVVTKDIPEQVVTYGVPSKTIRSRTKTEPYL